VLPQHKVVSVVISGNRGLLQNKQYLHDSSERMAQLWNKNFTVLQVSKLLRMNAENNNAAKPHYINKESCSKIKDFVVFISVNAFLRSANV
jgi:hypothetical protein